MLTHEEENLTPAMVQYYEIKKQYADCVVFFRMGDFYEMFDEDARIAHKVLGINLTTRNKNAKEPIPLAGIPYHAKEKYLPKIIEAGYKVAIVEQVSDPKLKGIIKREVTRVVSPATLGLEGENYDLGNDSRYIVSLLEEKGIYSVSTINISNNEWKVYETDNISVISQILYKINPQEVILEKGYLLSAELESILKSKFHFSLFFHTIPQYSKKYLQDHFGLINLSSYGIEEKILSQKSASILLSYLQENQKGKLSFLTSIRFEHDNHFMQLDEATIKSLDIFYNYSTKSEIQGTLFGVLSKTSTIGGKRMLKKNLLAPLVSKDKIEHRLNFVEELKKSPILLTHMRQYLSDISDIDVILNRICLDRTNPRDLLSLKKSLESILLIQTLIFEQGSEKLKQYFKKIIESEVDT